MTFHDFILCGATNASDRLRWTQHFKEFSTMTELDRRAVVALIHSIKVIGKNDVKITFRYQMEYEQVSERLARNGKKSFLQKEAV